MIALQNLLAAWRRVRLGFWRYVEFDLFFKVFALVLLQPALAWLSRALISSTGYAAVSNEQIFSFFISPNGVVFLVLIGTLTFAVVFAEQAGFRLVDAALRTGRETKAAEALWLTFRLLPKLSALGGLLIFLVGLAVLPFLVAGFLAHATLLSGADINYYLTEKPTEFWLALVIGAALVVGGTLVLAWLYGRWVFALPVSLFEGKGPVEAFRKSSAISAGQRWMIARTMLLWVISVVGAGAVLTAAFDFFGGFLVVSLGGTLKILLIGLGFFVVLYLAALGVLAFVGVAVSAALVSDLYMKMSAEKGFEVSFGSALGPERTLAARTRFRTANKVLWLVAVVALLSSGVTALVLAHDLRAEQPVEVTAHRGSSSRAPENTLSALRAAIKDGADYAEIDVQETADGVIVLLHDEDLMRLAGVDWKIWETDYSELADLDLGGWFSPQFAGERVATLEEAIELSRGVLKLNVELKYNGHDEALAARVVEILRTGDFAEHSVITSLDLDGLERVRDLDDRIRVGYIVASSVGDISRLDVDFFSVGAGYASADLVRRIKRRGKDVHVWTVNTPKAMSFFIDLGVDNIITDHPAVLRQMLTERAELDEAERILLAFRNWLRH